MYTALLVLLFSDMTLLATLPALSMLLYALLAQDQHRRGYWQVRMREQALVGTATMRMRQTPVGIASMRMLDPGVSTDHWWLAGEMAAF